MVVKQQALYPAELDLLSEFARCQTLRLVALRRTGYVCQGRDDVLLTIVDRLTCGMVPIETSNNAATQAYSPIAKTLRTLPVRAGSRCWKAWFGRYFWWGCGWYLDRFILWEWPWIRRRRWHAWRFRSRSVGRRLGTRRLWVWIAWCRNGIVRVRFLRGHFFNLLCSCPYVFNPWTWRRFRLPIWLGRQERHAVKNDTGRFYLRRRLWLERKDGSNGYAYIRRWLMTWAVRTDTRTGMVASAVSCISIAVALCHLLFVRIGDGDNVGRSEGANENTTGDDVSGRDAVFYGTDSGLRGATGAFRGSVLKCRFGLGELLGP